MLRNAARGPMGRVLGLAIFAGGFLALFKGFLDPNVPVGILGGVMIPLGMWIVAEARGAPPASR